jgi:oligopeptide transport system permease protein
MKWSLRIAVLFLVTVTLLSCLAPFVTSFAPDEQDVSKTFLAPSLDHFFGTDALGRDLFSRILYGGRVSLSIALLTATASVSIGIIYGTIAGWFGGTVDRVLMRFIVLGRGFWGLTTALVITGWLGSARITRAQVLSWKERPFVEAGRALGLPSLRLVTRHILPNCLGPVIVDLSYQIPTNVLAEAFLSFLGVGLRPPTPSWGILADEGWRALQVFPHLIFFPGLVIFITMLSFNIIGDQLRDRLDPTLRVNSGS